MLKRRDKMNSVITIRSSQLDKDDLKKLLQSIRHCEQANFPDKVISITMDVPEMPVEEVVKLIKGIKPDFGGGLLVLKKGGVPRLV